MKESSMKSSVYSETFKKKKKTFQTYKLSCISFAIPTILFKRALLGRPELCQFL